ncbi:MAG: hypothetical protein LBL72_03140 [Candidatus Accumulibacter sp.]|jgi:hypothetical protein|nr:hypothetical protein [Accumulibacter sp.]
MAEKTRSFSLGTIFAALLAVFFAHPGARAAALERRAQEVFAWRLVNQERGDDGAFTSTFSLEGWGTGDASGTPEIVYRAARREGRGSGTNRYAAPEFYRAKIEAGASRFSIRSNRSEQLELWAKIRRGDAIHYAQTLFAAFGQSGRGHENAEALDSPPDWPAFALSSVGTFYRAQTGVELAFRVRPTPVGLTIFENRAPVARPSVNAEGFYRYTPPHEAGLAKAGFSAKKDLLIVADLPDGRSRVSFYLPIYRAFHGQADVKGGLSVLLAGAAFASTLVWLWSRKFPWR